MNLLAGSRSMLAALLLAAGGQPVWAAVLTFDGGFNEFTLNSALQPYGDAIDGRIVGDAIIQEVGDRTFVYGAEGGVTPAIQSSYNDNARFFSAYGGLKNVLYPSRGQPTGPPERDKFTLTLSASPDFLVELHGFDLAGFPTLRPVEYTIQAVEVRGADGAPLFTASGEELVIPGGTDALRHFAFDEPLVASMLVIIFDTTNLPGENMERVAIDNVHFRQRPVPLPPAFGLFALALINLGILCRRRHG